MSEVEIKLRVPVQALPGLRRALARGLCTETRLHAVYFDTPDARLAAMRWALRLRREGTTWVQTLKGPAAGPLQRFEHEAVLGRGRGRPALDPQRLAESEPGRALVEQLGDGLDALAPVFEVDFRRTHRLLRSGGATVELALDIGRIACGDAVLPVCEFELESKSGSRDALIALADRWATRHGLWLDLRSKSERGYALRGTAAGAERAGKPRLTPKMSAGAALRAGIEEALGAIVANTARLADGSGEAEHVHQARVGIRRVLSLLRIFADAAPGAEDCAMEQGRTLFRALGAARDRDVLQAWLLPALQAAGGPPLQLPAPAGADTDAASVCRSPAMTSWLLALIAFIEAAPADAAAASESASLERICRRLARLHRQLRGAGEGFTAIDDEERHRQRKRLKRLRYAADALSSLFPAGAWRAYESRLKAAQEALGHFNDICVAQALLATMAADDPGAAFARGWLAASKPATLRDAGRALRALGRAPKFLR